MPPYLQIFTHSYQLEEEEIFDETSVYQQIYQICFHQILPRTIP